MHGLRPYLRGGASAARRCASWTRSLNTGRLLHQPRVRVRGIPSKPERPVRGQALTRFSARPSKPRFGYLPDAASAVTRDIRAIPARQRDVAAIVDALSPAPPATTADIHR